MVEPIVAVEPVVTPAVEPAVEPVTSFFGNDGTLAEGWQGTLDESLREENSLKTFKTVGDLAKSFVLTKSMVGKDMIEVPTDASSEAAREAFRKAGGRPDTVADYNLKAPDGFPEEMLEQVFPKAKIEAWQDRFFKAGISKKSADEFINNFAQDMLTDHQGMQQAEEMKRTELVGKLATEWGAAFEQKKHLGNIAVDEGTKGDDEFKTRLTEKFGNDPDFIRYSSNLGSKFAEGKSPDFAAVPTPSDYQNQIDAIQENPLYMNGTQDQRMKLANQIMVLRRKMKPEANV